MLSGLMLKPSLSILIRKNCSFAAFSSSVAFFKSSTDISGSLKRLSIYSFAVVLVISLRASAFSSSVNGSLKTATFFIFKNKSDFSSRKKSYSFAYSLFVPKYFGFNLFVSIKDFFIQVSIFSISA